MADWGWKEHTKPWPSRTRVWTLGAVLLTFVFLAGLLTGEVHEWVDGGAAALADGLHEERARSQALPTATGKYMLLEGVTGKGQRLLIDNEIEPVMGPDGRQGWRPTDEGVRDGIARSEWVTATYNDRGLHALLGQYVFKNETSLDFIGGPLEWTAVFFVLPLFVAVPKDRARRMVWKHGRSLRGPELVTTAEFNANLSRPDGIPFVNKSRRGGANCCAKMLAAGCVFRAT